MMVTVVRIRVECDEDSLEEDVNGIIRWNGGGLPLLVSALDDMKGRWGR